MFDVVIRYKTDTGSAVRLEGQVRNYPTIDEEYHMVVKHDITKPVRIDFGHVRKIVHWPNCLEFTTDKCSFYLTEQNSSKEGDVRILADYGHLRKYPNVVSICDFKNRKQKDTFDQRIIKLRKAIDNLSHSIISLKNKELPKKD